jgi:aldehyde:ferredoxin oxidoreductase
MNPPGLPVPQFDPKSWVGRGEAQVIDMFFNHIKECVGCCDFVFGTFPNSGVLIEFLNAITGWNMSMKEALKTGERIYNMRHAFNLREGLNPIQFKTPDRVMGIPPLKEGPLAGKTMPEATMVAEICKALDWDPKTSKPGKNKLVELGLEDVANALGID